MPYLVTLNQIGRHPRPAVGDFLWMQEHERHVWKGKPLHTIEEIMAAVNEAVPFLKRIENPYLEMSIVAVAGPEEGEGRKAEGDGAAETETVSELRIQNDELRAKVTRLEEALTLMGTPTVRRLKTVPRPTEPPLEPGTA